MKFRIVAWRLVREITRDKRTMAFFILVPVLVMTLVHYSLTGADTATVGLVSRGTARLFEGDIAAALEEQDDIRLADPGIPDSLTDNDALHAVIRTAVRAGRADAVLLLEKGLLADRFSGKAGTLHLYLEGSRPTKTATIYSAVAAAMDDLAASLPVAAHADCSDECLESFNNLPMDLEEHYLHGSKDLRVVDYFLPVFPPFFVFFLTFIISTVTFQRERTGGTLERLLIAPVSILDIVGGYVGGFFLFATVQAAIILGYILMLLQFEVGFGQIASLFMLCLLVMTVALLLGLLASFLAANEFQAIQFIPLVILPQVFLSDMIWDVQSYHPAVRALASIFPLTHANQAVRGILIQGRSLWTLWPQLLALAAYLPIVAGGLGFVAGLHKRKG